MDHTLTKIEAELDEMSLAQRLAGAVQFQTISYNDYARVDTAAFQELHAYLHPDQTGRYHAGAWLQRMDFLKELCPGGGILP